MECHIDQKTGEAGLACLFCAWIFNGRSVAIDASSKFVMRAKNADGVADRTFSYTVSGPDEPVWEFFKCWTFTKDESV